MGKCFIASQNTEHYNEMEIVDMQETSSPQIWNVASSDYGANKTWTHNDPRALAAPLPQVLKRKCDRRTPNGVKLKLIELIQVVTW